MNGSLLTLPTNEVLWRAIARLLQTMVLGMQTPSGGSPSLRKGVKYRPALHLAALSTGTDRGPVGSSTSAMIRKSADPLQVFLAAQPGPLPRTESPKKIPDANRGSLTPHKARPNRRGPLEPSSSRVSMLHAPRHRQVGFPRTACRRLRSWVASDRRHPLLETIVDSSAIVAGFPCRAICSVRLGYRT